MEKITNLYSLTPVENGWIIVRYLKEVETENPAPLGSLFASRESPKEETFVFARLHDALDFISLKEESKLWQKP